MVICIIKLNTNSVFSVTLLRASLSPNPLKQNLQKLTLSLILSALVRLSTPPPTKAEASRLNSVGAPLLKLAEMAALPNEIINEILVRLPVKSLLRFRSVSQLWLQLISARQFARQHNWLQSHDDRLKVLYGLNESPISLSSCSVAHLMYDEELHVQPIGVGLKLVRVPYDEISVVGSCNGVVCLATLLGDVVLWNPATRIYRILPSSEDGHQSLQSAAYGFGYDEGEDDYKVVKHISTVKGGYSTVSNVYSSRSNSWTWIEDVPGGVYIEESGMFVNGAIHWIGIHEDHTFVVLSLDVVVEMYAELSQPDYGEVLECVRLGVWRGCLSILSTYCETELNLWVMKEYGIGSSWTKLVRIPYFPEVSQILVPRPCFTTEKGDVLLNCGEV
ncbi:hypothetical protein Pfo_010985 [Paulownia fortunei]|nr:hypothetical protein Pfo_010985 [Paulownia fortunei]